MECFEKAASSQIAARTKVEMVFLWKGLQNNGRAISARGCSSHGSRNERSSTYTISLSLLDRYYHKIQRVVVLICNNSTGSIYMGDRKSVV